MLLTFVLESIVLFVKYKFRYKDTGNKKQHPSLFYLLSYQEYRYVYPALFHGPTIKIQIRRLSTAKAVWVQLEFWRKLCAVKTLNSLWAKFVIFNFRWNSLKYFQALLIAVLFFHSSYVFASSPPFDSLTIYGNANTKYNKVALFENGSSTTPYKAEEVVYFNGEYSITIDIPSDMKKKKDYYSTDLRFWGDINENGIKDKGDTFSQCHFIIWVPSTNKIYLQVYKGEKYTIDTAYFKYYYK